MFKLPNSPGVFYQEWKQKVVDVLRKYKDMEGDVWEQKIKKGLIFTCERHYNHEDFERTGEFGYLDSAIHGRFLIAVILFDLTATLN